MHRAPRRLLGGCAKPCSLPPPARGDAHPSASIPRSFCAVERRAPDRHAERRSLLDEGIIYKDQGNAENARSSFQTAVEVDPDFYDGYIALGLACAEANDTLAIGYYETAMRLKPRSVEARYDLAYFLQECRPLNPVYLERALDLYRSISAIDSMNAAAAFNRGYIHLEYLQQYDSAALHFTEAIDVLPYYHQAFFNRGLSHESLGLVAEAESDYRQALGLKPDFTPAAMALERVLATP